jgi:GTP-binding protein
MFRVVSSEFVISAAQPKQFPPTDLPEVAFVGRSNVGKSSLLNVLTGRKSLAKISGTPGKTRQINFFLINELCHFVDLPGYGYAKVSKDERESWKKLIESYLTGRDQLRLVLALSDIRHEPTALDRTLFEWLDALEQPYQIVLTKHDKISPGAAEARVAEVAELTAQYTNRQGVISFSSQTKHNRDEILKVIGAAVGRRRGGEGVRG